MRRCCRCTNLWCEPRTDISSKPSRSSLRTISRLLVSIRGPPAAVASLGGETAAVSKPLRFNLTISRSRLRERSFCEKGLRAVGELLLSLFLPQPHPRLIAVEKLDPGLLQRA